MAETTAATNNEATVIVQSVDAAQAGSVGKRRAARAGVDSKFESELDAETWQFIMKQALQEQKESVKSGNDAMDAILLFATLFSAVVTAFVIESYHSLQGDDSGVSLETLQFTPSQSAVRINICWFASLVISISTAFLAILGKQWLSGIKEGFSPIPEIRGRQLQFRRDQFERWRVSHTLSTLPILLHISLLLFFAGLVEFLWFINRPVAIVAASIAAATFFFYIATHIISLVGTASPYRTTLTTLILVTANTLMMSLAPTSLALAETFTELSLDKFRASRTKYKSEWSKTRMGRYFTTRYREIKYITSNAEEMDARAIARAIAALSPSDPRARDFTKKMYLFEPLLSQRRFLSHDGVVELLAKELRRLYNGSLTEENRDDVLFQSRRLAQLLTETKEDMSHATTLIEGIPIFYDHQISMHERGTHPLCTSGLCSPDESVSETADLSFFANMFRLQFVVSSEDWYKGGISYSIDQFYSRIQNPEKDNLDDLSENQLIALVHTTIYTAMRPVGGLDLHANDLHTARALDTLAAIALLRSNMSYAVQRQISYGIWLCAEPGLFTSDNLLIPYIRRAEPLSMPLTQYLVSGTQRLSLARAILAVIEPLLNSGREDDGLFPRMEEAKDRVPLTQELLKQYPTFLAAFAHRLREDLGILEHPWLSRLLASYVQQILPWGCLPTPSPRPGIEVDRSSISDNTLVLLSILCQNISALVPGDQAPLMRAAYGTVCKLAASQAGRPDSSAQFTLVEALPKEKHQLPAPAEPPVDLNAPPPTSRTSVTIDQTVMEAEADLHSPSVDRHNCLFADATAEDLARVFIEALQAGAVAVSDGDQTSTSMETMLTMIAQLSIGEGRSDDVVVLNSGILASLREPSHGVVGMLKTIGNSLQLVSGYALQALDTVNAQENLKLEMSEGSAPAAVVPAAS
ncbi:hypothetical protein WOLCODRAFT_149453 [Wolfiporia cocos MD-104 SS10]|uniref:DUF6535 domain-containing protein n=1 Tax=Wolfiporia cocos (strain MD-104) TaxID=742152 RepID=A0A2H3JPF8_WOLCO|nr:hypothetical protein WOLCODRAFT_149453 [Wolfiporia cocos MD-104 SS10]